jgi:hypothetical protein
MHLGNISLMKKIQLTGEKTLSEVVREDCQTFLKTKEGLKYLQKNYTGPIELAVNKYINEVTWITNIV